MTEFLLALVVALLGVVVYDLEQIKKALYGPKEGLIARVMALETEWGKR